MGMNISLVRSVARVIKSVPGLNLIIIKQSSLDFDVFLFLSYTKIVS